MKVFFTSVEVRPELGSIDLVGKSGTECVLANKKGLGLLSVCQDGGADPLWVKFHVCSAGPVGTHWGGKTWNIGSKTYIDMCKLRYK